MANQTGAVKKDPDIQDYNWRTSKHEGGPRQVGTLKVAISKWRASLDRTMAGLAVCDGRGLVCDGTWEQVVRIDAALRDLVQAVTLRGDGDDRTPRLYRVTRRGNGTFCEVISEHLPDLVAVLVAADDLGSVEPISVGKVGM